MAAFAVMLVMCMGAVLALWVAIVCVALLCTLLPMARRTRPHMRALMHHAPLLPGTLQCSSASLAQIQATSSPSLRAAKGRKRRRRARKPTQSHQAAAASASADPHTYVPPSILPSVQSAIELFVRIEPQVRPREEYYPGYCEHGQVGLCGSARVLLRTENPGY